MTISVADYTDEQATIQVETSKGPLAVTYRPNALTPALELQMAQSRDGSAYFALFCEVVAELDLAGPLYDPEDRDEAGNPRQIVGAGALVPITPTTVALLPSRLLGKIMDAIQADLIDGPDPKASPKASRNGSFAHR